MGSKYKQYDRRLKEQFINDHDDENLIPEIVKELIALKDVSEMGTKQV